MEIKVLKNPCILAGMAKKLMCFMRKDHFIQSIEPFFKELG